MGWHGAGGWVTRSHDRQAKRSRTVWITPDQVGGRLFHRRGTTSSVSVTSPDQVGGRLSPSLDSVPPQQGQAAGAGTTTRSRGR